MMKTLDEVIHALEVCTSGYCSNHDGDCPYLGHYDCNDEQRNLDALHYLKDYRMLVNDFAEKRQELEDEKARYQEAVKNCEEAENKFRKMEDELNDIRREHIEQMRNPPLTWDELKQMEGKPVWLEVKGYNGCWTIVHWNSNIVFVEFYDWIASPDDFMKAPLVSLDDTNFGTAWQAYRKER